MEGLDQDSKEWLEWRSDGIGSSDIALLMSPEPLFDRTVGTLWKQRVGYERAPELNNEHIHRGKRLEPLIRDEVNKILGSSFAPECVMRKDAPYLRASLDGIDYNLDAILEIKSPSDKVFEKYLKEWKIPYNYYLQMQYQMLCSDTECAYFSFGRETADGLEVYIIPVKNDYALQLDIERRCSLFWKGVQTKTPVGWKDNVLSMYHTNPTMFVIVCDKPQIIQILKIKNLPLPIEVVMNAKRKDSFIFILDDPYIQLTSIKTANPEHKVKIINLIPSPFSNKVDEVKLTKTGITEHIKTLL